MLFKLFGLFVLIAICNAAKVPVHVYYESLCPDSQAFITQQLYPTIKGPLGKYVDLTLVPYGKSNYTTLGADVIFTCHHGPNECYGNKIQSCAIKNIEVNSYQNEHTKESLTLEYINCLMRAGNNFPDSIYPGEKCAIQTGINNWEIIKQCANETSGSKLLQRNGELTDALNPKLTSVPTITFSHQYTREAQDLALKNFPAAVCKKLSISPPECSNIPGSSAGQSAAIAVIATTFLLARLF